MSDARCEEFRELLSAFVDESLDGGELLYLERHLRECAACRLFEEELRRLKGLLQAAEAFRPPRRPPAGFAAMVTARLDREAPVRLVAFPEAPVRRVTRRPWIGMIAAAAAAAIFFAWSWQRLLPVDSPEQKLASPSIAAGVDVAAADNGSMDTWMREHAMLARDSTLLGPAEEIEFARFRADAVPER